MIAVSFFRGECIKIHSRYNAYNSPLYGGSSRPCGLKPIKGRGTKRGFAPREPTCVGIKTQSSRVWGISVPGYRLILKIGLNAA
jgi:hypothetical protein